MVVAFALNVGQRHSTGYTVGDCQICCGWVDVGFIAVFDCFVQRVYIIVITHQSLWACGHAMRSLQFYCALTAVEFTHLTRDMHGCDI